MATSKKQTWLVRFFGTIGFAAAAAYFYVCDDVTLAGPIIAITARWGVAYGILIGAAMCLLWNIPQTRVFLRQMQGGRASDNRWLRLLEVVGWLQPVVVGYIAYGIWAALVALVLVGLLWQLTQVLQKKRSDSADWLEKHLKRFAGWLWGNGGAHGWGTLLLAVFFIGPQMSLLSPLGAGVRGVKLQLIALVLLIVYSVEFAAAYAGISLWWF